MSDGNNSANKNYHKRVAEELKEAEANRYQIQLDRWWEAQRDLDWEEDDVSYVGGFQERWSQTPSFTKTRRVRDWRVR